MSAVVGYGSNNYSTDEQVIGKWIDGKPLYQKTYDCGAMPTGSSNVTKTVPFNILDLDIIVACFGVTTNLSNGNGQGLPVASTYSVNQAEIYWSRNDVTVRCNNTVFANYNYYLTIQYTKTTD